MFLLLPPFIHYEFSLIVLPNEALVYNFICYYAVDLSYCTVVQVMLRIKFIWLQLELHYFSISSFNCIFLALLMPSFMGQSLCSAVQEV